MMHNSDDPEKETAGVRLYLDESGGDDPNTPHAVIGGIIINKYHFQPFEDAWDDMLDRHGIIPPLHMKEFGKHGKFRGMSTCCRRELFQEAAQLIDSHKVCSLNASLSNDEYKSNVPQSVRDRFSVYGMCFILSVVMNHHLARDSSPPYHGRIPFILDSGNPYAWHVRRAHAMVLKMQREEMFLHAGSLTFDDDKDFGVLQAADVIAWGARRHVSGLPIPYAFEPIGDILQEANAHNRASWTPALLAELGNVLATQITKQAKDQDGFE